MLVVASCARGRSEQPPTDALIHRPPNLVLILVDALRRDHLGAYGYPKPTTPFTDFLAIKGVAFSNAYAQAPNTPGSTATLFTSTHFPFRFRGVEHDPIPGMDEERQRLWANTARLARANLTVAEVLQDAGYQTLGLFTNPHHHATSGYWQGFDDALYLPTEPGYPYGRVETVCREFRNWLANRDSNRPFFAYLHLMNVHNPYTPPTEQLELFPPGEGQRITSSLHHLLTSSLSHFLTCSKS